MDHASSAPGSICAGNPIMQDSVNYGNFTSVISCSVSLFRQSLSWRWSTATPSQNTLQIRQMMRTQRQLEAAHRTDNFGSAKRTADAFAQGLLGATSPKPTNLLVVNLSDLMWVLHGCRLRKELPTASSIGKDHWGRWRTTALKEYLPALCMGLALSSAFDRTPGVQSVTDPTEELLSRIQALSLRTSAT